MMNGRTRVFRSGNSLAVRVPSAVAQALGLGESSPVQIEVDPSQAAILVRKAERGLTLDDLVRSISPANLHDEQIATFVGKELW